MMSTTASLYLSASFQRAGPPNSWHHPSPLRKALQPRRTTAKFRSVHSNLPWFEPTFVSSPTALWSSEHDLKSRDFGEPAFVDFKLQDEEPAFVHVPGLEKQFGGAKSLGTESTSSGEDESLGNDVEVFAAGTWPDAAPYIPWGCTAHQPYAPDFSDFSQLPLWNSALAWNGAWWPNVGEDSLLCNEDGF